MIQKQKTAHILLLAVFLLVIDELLKYIFITGPARRIPLFGDILGLRAVENRNIAFSLPLEGFWLYLALLAAFLFLLYLMRSFYRERDDFGFNMTIILLFGAAGNLTDRLVYGFVVDYIDLKYFTVFNLADCMIVLSVAFMAIYYLLGKNKPNTQ